MSADSPILGVVDLTHITNLEHVPAFRDINMNTDESIKQSQETNMSKQNPNDVTTGLADLIKEIKGDHAKLGAGLKDILKEYHQLDLPNSEDAGIYSDELASMVDGLLSKLKNKHKDLLSDEKKNYADHFAQSFRYEDGRMSMKNNFPSFVSELDSKLFSFDGYNEYIEPFFVDIDEETCELWNFVPVLAYICWDAWEHEGLVDLDKMLKVIPDDKEIGPNELFAFIQVASVVYSQCREYSQK
jgi:hypothetical protein